MFGIGSHEALSVHWSILKRMRDKVNRTGDILKSWRNDDLGRTIDPPRSYLNPTSTVGVGRSYSFSVRFGPIWSDLDFW